MAANQKKRVIFSELWNNYPKSAPCINPNTNQKAYSNQCAIRVGLALEKSGVSFSSFKGQRCEFAEPKNGMALRAQELAAWLDRKPFQGCGSTLILAGSNFQSILKGRTGIIFFQDYWARDGEVSPTGDHIDLWNSDRLTPSIETFMRFSLGIEQVPYPNVFGWRPLGTGNFYSSLSKSKLVKFWSIQ